MAASAPDDDDEFFTPEWVSASGTHCRNFTIAQIQALHHGMTKKSLDDLAAAAITAADVELVRWCATVGAGVPMGHPAVEHMAVELATHDHPTGLESLRQVAGGTLPWPVIMLAAAKANNVNVLKLCAARHGATADTYAAVTIAAVDGLCRDAIVWCSTRPLARLSADRPSIRRMAATAASSGDTECLEALQVITDGAMPWEVVMAAVTSEPHSGDPLSCGRSATGTTDASL